MKSEIKTEEFKSIAKDLLTEVHFFCEENNIKYFLCYGTLLGAIRHKGFIPWDDDIDIAMPRESFERFIKDFKPKKNFVKLVTADNEEAYYLPFPKVIDERTVVEEEVNSSFKSGVWVDVFPVDNYGNGFFDKVLLTIRSILGNLLLLKNLKVNKERSFFKNKIITLSHFILFCWSSNFLAKSINNIAKRLNKRNVNSSTSAILTDYKFGDNYKISSEWLIEFTFAQFDEGKYRIPSRYDEILTKFYGNYMELPPESERVSNHTYKVYWK